MNMQYTDLIWLMAGMFVISLTYIFTLLIVSISNRYYFSTCWYLFGLWLLYGL